MHLFLWAEDSETDLRAELTQTFPGVALETVHQSMLRAELPGGAAALSSPLVFARQFVPDAQLLSAKSIREWADAIVQHLVGVVPEDKPWILHVAPYYGVPSTHRIGARAWHTALRHGQQRAVPAKPAIDPQAGQQRCRLIHGSVLEQLQRKRRHLLRCLRKAPAPFTPEDSLVQVLLMHPESGYISLALAPSPFEQRRVLSWLPLGMAPNYVDKTAPSRAFSKLAEAELRSGRQIRAGETCVDLGASPGSWTYWAVQRGARVVAVDRSPVRDDLMAHAKVRFSQADAFRFKPEQTVDWLLCDVIAAPERSAALLLEWLRNRWCRKFVVSIKLGDHPCADVLQMLKRELPALAAEYYLTRLNANKKEVCAFGWR